MYGPRAVFSVLAADWAWIARLLPPLWSDEQICKDSDFRDDGRGRIYDLG